MELLKRRCRTNTGWLDKMRLIQTNNWTYYDIKLIGHLDPYQEIFLYNSASQKENYNPFVALKNKTYALCWTNKNSESCGLGQISGPLIMINTNSNTDSNTDSDTDTVSDTNSNQPYWLYWYLPNIRYMPKTLSSH